MRLRSAVNVILVLVLPALGSWGADQAIGTLTVKGKTRILRYAYASLDHAADDPKKHYLVLLLSDSAVPESKQAISEILVRAGAK